MAVRRAKAFEIVSKFVEKVVKRSSRFAYYRFRLQRMVRAVQNAVARSGPLNFRAIAKDLLYTTGLGQAAVVRLARGAGSQQVREYAVDLPPGYPAIAVRIKLTVPKIPGGRLAGFSEHVIDSGGRPTDTVLATITGGYAVSRDLGKIWDTVRIRDRRFARHQLLHLKSIGNFELLAQAAVEPWRPGLPRELDNLVLNLDGDVLAANHLNGSHWHGCRSVDISGQTLMYAEYPYEDPEGTIANRASSRVMRSRDRGRTWEAVFELTGNDVRHFHFLQARPNSLGEWWLTSGDKPHESRIWVSRDDGETWSDMTALFGEQIPIDGLKYPRTVFRLTDLVWENDTLLWGTDDYLARNRFPSPGARMFRSPVTHLQPRVAGIARWPIRNIVDVGDFYAVLTQGCARQDASPAEKKPGAYLLPKRRIESAPDMVHLFDIDVYSSGRTGFTYSRASRAARNGTFFSYRASTDAFPFGHKLLKWEVAFC